MDTRTTLAKKASLLRLSALSLAEGMRSGSFRSLYRGQGIEFSGVREYLRGDDVRTIDWNVTARMGRPFVKTFNEERELDVFLIIDASLSMCCGSGKQSRLDKAMECASLLVLASLQNASPVGAVIFGGELLFSCPPSGGEEQALLLLSQFGKDHARRQDGTVLDNALQGAGRLLRKRTLVMVFSDFRTSGWLAPFGRLCQGNDVVAARIHAPSDEKLPAVGSVSFADAEGTLTRVLPTSSKTFQSAWRDAHRQRVNVWRKECIRHGGIPLELSTEKDSAAELTSFFAAREIR
ncbi:MAG TPA: DUF58 domain-containing protein [Treponema sp.]|nr:DUF58 domain-containing protein [Treponema sp.]